MQSKQKKVKWSRGETASALEERTDTGITEVSVAKMQNIISDIYGNISRRPALKIVEKNPYTSSHVPLSIGPNGTMPWPTRTFVFTIDANSYIIFVQESNGTLTGFLIQNDKFTRRISITNNTPLSLEPQTGSTPISSSQYNNYMVVYGVYSAPVVLRLTPDNNIIVDYYRFSAPWVAPNGTETKVVSSTTVPGMQINKDGNGFSDYTYTDESGVATVYSWIDTGLTGSSQTIAEQMPAGSIIQLANIGVYMRVEGYTVSGQNLSFADTHFDGVLNYDQTIPSTGTYVRFYFSVPFIGENKAYLTKYVNGVSVASREFAVGTTVTVFNNASSTGLSKVTLSSTASTWSEETSGKIMMFGALLTPAADATEKDTVVTVEYGYISLQSYHPEIFTFSQQRLYASKWTTYNPQIFPKQIPGYAVGSQIARYNDFKNDYNQENEPLAIDISTSYQEQIINMTDYNGLKIFTDAAEYAYSADTGPVKQSENGCKADCSPIVFSSVLLYADKSKQQIRAMQYELGSNLFDSTTVNQFAQEDLIFNTASMVGYQDKEHCTGTFLYCIQNTGDMINPVHAIAVCNLVPQNQAMIWSRWEMPKIYDPEAGGGARNVNCVTNAIEINNKVWFVVELFTNLAGYEFVGHTLAELDFDATMDFETEVSPDETKAIVISNTEQPPLYAWKNTSATFQIVYSHKANPEIGDIIYDNENRQILAAHVTSINPLVVDFGLVSATYTRSPSDDIIEPYGYFGNTTISVFDGDKYMWDDTIDKHGTLTKPLTDLEHPKIGFKIDAELISHPMDIGGKTYTTTKRIAKAKMVVRNTEPGAVQINDKYGYMDLDKKIINFYNVTGMKKEVKYIIKNKNGAKFTIESIMFDMEYGTLD